MLKLNRVGLRAGIAAAAVALLLAGCVTTQPKNPLAQWEASKNFDLRRPVLVVLHYTQQHSVEQSLETLKTANSKGPVSAHYLVGKDGRVYQLVSETRRAWHAGPGRWGTITDVNSASIGIEIDNDGSSPFTDVQIDSVIRLLGDITKRQHIPPSQVIGHSDLAPTRKVDPGKLFPWQRLAEAGYGLWIKGELRDPPPGFDPWLALAAIGYSLDDRPAAVRAFHQHFRGSDATELDAEDMRVLDNLSQQQLGTASP